MRITAGNKGISFKITLANQGDVHFRLKKSVISVKNSKGEEVAKVEMPAVPGAKITVASGVVLGNESHWGR